MDNIVWLHSVEILHRPNLNATTKIIPGLKSNTTTYAHKLAPLAVTHVKHNKHRWLPPVLVGVGKTVLKYFASEDGMLSFANNKPVKIFSKGAGSNPDLWGVMVS